MNTVPIIEVAPLDTFVYEKDRTTVVGRPTIILMINPICGCLLHNAIVTTQAPSEALAKTFLSWQRERSIGTEAQTVSVDGRQEFRSSTFVEAANRAGYNVQYRTQNHEGTAERVFMSFSQQINLGWAANAASTHLTLAEIKRIVRIGVMTHNKQRGKSTGSYKSEPGYKSRGAGIPLSVRRAYYSVLRASMKCGFDAEQVQFIWRTASYAYGVNELSMIFANVLSKLHSTKTYHGFYQADVT